MKSEVSYTLLDCHFLLAFISDHVMETATENTKQSNFKLISARFNVADTHKKKEKKIVSKV